MKNIKKDREKFKKILHDTIGKSPLATEIVINLIADICVPDQKEEPEIKCFKCIGEMFNCGPCFSFTINNQPPDICATGSDWQETKRFSVTDKEIVPKEEAAGLKVERFICDKCEGGPCGISTNNKHGDCGRFNRSVNEEPELMTFFEALEKAKDGDTVQRSTDEGVYYVIKGKVDSQVFSVQFLMEEKWQIIPAEPKVFSVNEMLEKSFPPDTKMSDYSKGNMKYFGTKMYKKGSEEQWLNHKELRKAAENLRICPPNEISKAHDLLLKALLNLKPLKP